MSPVSGADLPALIALKADPLVFGAMLGGVRSPWKTMRELEQDVRLWGERGVGMFALREGASFQGVAGIHDRPDGLGLALRYAVWPEARGRGIAREAASAALRFAQDRAGIPRIVAVTRGDHFPSRTILGAIGMREARRFLRGAETMVLYESRAGQPALSWR